ncbi:hypothetical protein EF912_27685 [Streptomyces sp. WAC07061]|nr:hypothetical protein EF912_27685 [Streptomyces sp. WAC07061]
MERQGRADRRQARPSSPPPPPSSPGRTAHDARRTTHGARLLAEADPEPGGGLTVSLRFPAPHRVREAAVRGER